MRTLLADLIEGDYTMRIKPLLLSLPLGTILAGGILIEPAIAQDTARAGHTPDDSSGV